MNKREITHRVLSLGGGTQSSVLLLMASRGEIQPALDVAIFADTGWEPRSVYEHLDWLEGESEIPIVRVDRGRNLGDDTMNCVQHQGRPNLAIPAFVRNPDGSKGMLQHRQCTMQYKLNPIAKYTRENLLGVGYRQRVPSNIGVEAWLGISTDEIMRIRDGSTWAWQTPRYPLIEMGMSRADCLAWFAEHYPSRSLPRSACVGCPFRSDKEWLAVKQSDPADFERTVAIDQEMRLQGKGILEGEAFSSPQAPPT